MIHKINYKERKPLLIFGTGPFSEIVDEYINKSCYNLVAFIEDEKYMKENIFRGLPVFNLESTKGRFYGSYIYVAVGYGGSSPNSIRQVKLEEMLKLGFFPFTFIHKLANVHSSKSFDESNHNFVFELNNIQPFVTIGNNNIFWAGNHIGHHSTIGSHNFFSSHVVVSGNCKIGDNNFFGVNSTIIDGITIGNGCIVGAGALVLKDVPDNTKVIGMWRGDKHRLRSKEI